MRLLVSGVLAAVLVLAAARPGAAEDYKAAVVKDVRADLKSTPAAHVVTLGVGKGKKDVKVRFDKDMKVYGADGKEVPAGNLTAVFRNGAVIDATTKTEGDKEVFVEARLVKKGK